MALAAWILEKFHGWSGCRGELKGCLSTDRMLTNVMVYWLTSSITSSMRLYKESLVRHVYTWLCPQSSQEHVHPTVLDGTKWVCAMALCCFDRRACACGTQDSRK